MTEKIALTNEFLNLNYGNVSWFFLSRYLVLNKEIIDEFKDFFVTEEISKNKSLTMEFLPFLELQYGYVSENIHITDELLEKYGEKLSLEAISKNPSLTDEFIKRNRKKINFFYLSYNKCFGMDLINKYINYIDISTIWKNPNIDSLNKINQVKKYGIEIDFRILCQNISINADIIDEFFDKIDWYLLSINPAIYNNITMISKYRNKLFWKSISELCILNQDFIHDFKNYLNWKYISKNNNLKDNLIVKTDIDWKVLSRYNRIITLKFIEKYESFIDFKLISSNPYISFNIISKYFDKIDLEILINQNIGLSRKTKKYFISYFDLQFEE